MSSSGSSPEYDPVIKDSAKRDLKKLEKRNRQMAIQIVSAIDELRRNPRMTGTEKLSASGESYRFRVGDFRILFTIEDAARTFTISRVRDRKDVYRH